MEHFRTRVRFPPPPPKNRKGHPRVALSVFGVGGGRRTRGAGTTARGRACPGLDPGMPERTSVSSMARRASAMDGASLPDVHGWTNAAGAGCAGAAAIQAVCHRRRPCAFLRSISALHRARVHDEAHSRAFRSTTPSNHPWRAHGGASLRGVRSCQSNTSARFAIAAHPIHVVRNTYTKTLIRIHILGSRVPGQAGPALHTSAVLRATGSAPSLRPPALRRLKPGSPASRCTRRMIFRCRPTSPGFLQCQGFRPALKATTLLLCPSQDGGVAALRCSPVSRTCIV